MNILNSNIGLKDNTNSITFQPKKQDLIQDCLDYLRYRKIRPDNTDLNYDYHYCAPVDKTKNGKNLPCLVATYSTENKTPQYIPCVKGYVKMFETGTKYTGYVWKHNSFNIDEPIFIVESVLCALSLIQSGFNAVAPGTANNLPTEFYNTLPKNIEIILAYDNDTAGHKSIKRDYKYLKDNNFNNIKIALSPIKDWNDVLMKDLNINNETIKESLEAGNNMIMKLDNELINSIDNEDNNEAVNWEKPIPLSRDIETIKPNFDLLPKCVADLCKEVKASTNFDDDLIFGTALSVLGSALTNKFKLHVKPEMEVYANTQTVIIASSTQGKTPVAKAFQKPFYIYDETLTKEYKSIHAEWETVNDVANIEIETHQKTLKTPKTNKYDKENAIRTITDIRINRIEEPLPPNLIVTNTTTEGLFDVIKGNHGHGYIFSSEGRDFIDILMGKYTNGKEDLTIYLDGRNGDASTLKRKNKEAVRIYPVIAMTILVQGDKYKELASNTAIQSSGFLPSLIQIFATGMRGHLTRTTINEVTQNKFNDTIIKILSSPAEINEQGSYAPKTIHLTDEAYLIYEKNKNNNIDDCNNNYLNYSSLYKNTLDKLTDHVLRLALSLHVFKHYQDNSPLGIIDKETMEQAVNIAEYYKSHIQKAHNIIGSSKKIVLARNLLDWIISNENRIKSLREKEGFSNLFAIKVGDIQQYVNWVDLDSKETILTVLNVLEEYNWIKQISTKRANNKITDFYYFNPLTPSNLPNLPNLVAKTGSKIDKIDKIDDYQEIKSDDVIHDDETSFFDENDINSISDEEYEEPTREVNGDM